MLSKTVVIVQARIGSTRLPNKMLLWMNGYPIIGWVLERLKSLREVDEIVFALPEGPDDDVLSSYLLSKDARVFRGSESDVLSRYLAAARINNAKSIIRICADNPFVVAAEIDRLALFFDEKKLDYAYNHIPVNNRYPNGFGAEIVSFEILDYVSSMATEKVHREHIFNFIWDNVNQFSIGTFDPTDSYIAHPEMRFDLDTLSDYSNLLRLNLKPECTTHEIINAALREANK